MKCPQCDYPNPTGATHCQLCSEVFNKSAADRYLHAQRKAARDEGRQRSEPDTYNERATYTPVSRILQESAASIPWRPYVSAAWTGLLTAVRTHTRELLFAVGMLGLGILILFFTSPAQRLQLFGKHITYRFAAKNPPIYLVSFHTDAKRWSEREGRLDTPLGQIQRDELGNVKLTLAQSGRRTQKILVQAREWIVTQAGNLPQTIPLSHASLKPVSITLDGKGRVSARAESFSFRVGRVSSFIMPTWPSRLLRTGTEWDEPVEWLSAYGDWKILWRGSLHWKMTGATTLGGVPCTSFTYQAHVEPRLWETPAWAKTLVHHASFTGTSTGEALFDTHARQLYSTDFFQEGAISLQLDDIYHIPMDVRVGRTPRHPWGQSLSRQPGVLIFQIKDKLAIRKS